MAGDGVATAGIIVDDLMKRKASRAGAGDE